MCIEWFEYIRAHAIYYLIVCGAHRLTHTLCIIIENDPGEQDAAESRCVVCVSLRKVWWLPTQVMQLPQTQHQQLHIH